MFKEIKGWTKKATIERDERLNKVKIVKDRR